jgi:hypothetical protein
MSERMDQMVRQFADKPSLEECPVHDLVNLCNRYPYAANFRLLLLHKYGAGASRSQLHSTALHFHNPLLLRKALHPEEFASDLDLPDLPAPVIEKPVVTETVGMPEPLPEETPALMHEPVIQEEHITESNITELQNALEEAPAPGPELPSLEIKQEPDTNAPITFEPYHTVDYFASQGIKLSKTENTDDSLGRQLRSFTEWLKTMKKLPATAITHNTDGAGEQKVQVLAAHSLDNLDVATEAMAEVWIKQGNPEKAIAIYQKLSLSNPGKSAYFAAKIESLKNTDH